MIGTIENAMQALNPSQNKCLANELSGVKGVV
jgi:hypothetical protein